MHKDTTTKVCPRTIVNTCNIEICKDFFNFASSISQEMPALDETPWRFPGWQRHLSPLRGGFGVFHRSAVDQAAECHGLPAVPWRKWQNCWVI